MPKEVVTMNQRKRRSLNVVLPEDQFLALETYCKESGYSKTQVVMAALNQYLAIKREEMDLKKEHPNLRIKGRVVMENDDRQRMASVLLY